MKGRRRTLKGVHTAMKMGGYVLGIGHQMLQGLLTHRVNRPDCLTYSSLGCIPFLSLGMTLHPPFSELSEDIPRRLSRHFALCQENHHHLHNYMQTQYWKTEVVTLIRDMLLIGHAVQSS